MRNQRDVEDATERWFWAIFTMCAFGGMALLAVVVWAIIKIVNHFT